MDLGLGEKVVLVAGSTRGIGLAIGRAFLQEGSRVVITGRNNDVLAAAVARLTGEGFERRVLALQGDMGVPAEVRRVVERTVEAFGTIDAAVLNVGSGVGPSGWDIQTEEWQASLGQNLIASAAAAREVIPYLIAKESGSVTFIGSIAALELVGAPIPYSAAKMSLLVVAKHLARQLGPHGVRVNYVAPGNIMFPGGRWAEKRDLAPDEVESYISHEVSLQRFGCPEDVANMVVFLTSTRAAFVTGSCVVVDGGQTRSW